VLKEKVIESATNMTGSKSRNEVLSLLCFPSDSVTFSCNKELFYCEMR